MTEEVKVPVPEGDNNPEVQELRKHDLDVEAPIVVPPGIEIHNGEVNSESTSEALVKSVVAQVVTELDANLRMAVNRINDLSDRVLFLEEKTNTLVDTVTPAINAIVNPTVKDLLNTPIKVGPVTVTFRVLPRQDVWHDGQNLPGKDGLSITVDDGAVEATVAKVVYDPAVGRFIAQTGKGVF